MTLGEGGLEEPKNAGESAVKLEESKGKPANADNTAFARALTIFLYAESRNSDITFGALKP